MSPKEWSASGAEYLVSLLVQRADTKIIGRPLVVLDVVGSTSDWLKDAAERGAPEGFTLLALEQTAGRGRQGREWRSQRAAGVWMSVLLRPHMTVDQTPFLGVMAGLAMLWAVRSVGLVGASLKWPNDVMAGDRKVAGTLVEPRVARKWVQFVILGFGLNVSQSDSDWDESLRDKATSLKMQGVEVGYGEAAVALISAVDKYYLRAKTQGWEAFCSEWASESGTDLLPVISG